MGTDFSRYFDGADPDKVIDIIDFQVVKDGHGSELGRLVHLHEGDSPADLARLLGCNEDVAMRVRYWCLTPPSVMPSLDRPH